MPEQNSDKTTDEDDECDYEKLVLRVDSDSLRLPLELIAQLQARGEVTAQIVAAIRAHLARGYADDRPVARQAALAPLSPRRTQQP